MAEKEKSSADSGHISWHPAFVQAMRMELEPYKGVLKFISEHQLTSEPQKIDLVIIMKEPGIAIDKNIARIFRRVNILEYKSPEDNISSWDFYKVLSYAAQYAYQNKTGMRDMTVSFVAARHPRELLKFFRDDKDCAVTEESPGIYRITGYRLGIQIVETKKLAPEDNLWLRGLDKGLNAETAGSIIEASRGKYEPDIAAYLYAVLLANAKILAEVSKMSKTEEAKFYETMKKAGLTAKWEAQVRAEGEQTAWEKVVSLLKQGYTVDQLERMVPAGIDKE
ncbi:MAG: hypothetical protein LBL31_06720 [Spirochaetaceae bacterium]|jgi:hypothetical protein|nr:hypothetical protein [Spirochaetaceae bacterium]